MYNLTLETEYNKIYYIVDDIHDAEIQQLMHQSYVKAVWIDYYEKEDTKNGKFQKYEKGRNKMYLIEVKLGDMKIQKYIGNAQILGQLIQENMNNYDYIKILEEIPNNELEKPKVKKRVKKND